MKKAMTFDEWKAMTAAMAAAMVAAKAPLAQKPIPEKDKGATAPAKAAEKETTVRRPSQQKELVKFPAGKKVTVAFSCSIKSLPEGIRAVPLSGGGTNGAGSHEEGEREGIRLSDAVVDADSIVSRVSVDAVKVFGRLERCFVYIDCTTGVGPDAGFNHWKSYEAFVRKGLARTYGRVVVKEMPDGRTRIDLRKANDERAVRRIQFAIEQ